MAYLIYRHRRDAGQRLVPLLAEFAAAPDTVVLGLPRGGVPVAREIASALDLPLDVLVVRKLGCPGQPEYAMGAIASGGILVTNESFVESVPNAAALLRECQLREEVELRRRESLFRGEHPALAVAGKTVLLVDDGMATGSTMRAALLSLQQRHARRLIAVIPVAAPDALREIARVADDVICPLTPAGFRGVGQFYADFQQTSDEEVQECLRGNTAAGTTAQVRLRS